MISEDGAHFRFFRRLFEKLGCAQSERVIRENARTTGDGKQAVVTQVGSFIRTWNARRAKRYSFLVIVTDADNDSVLVRERSLIREIENSTKQRDLTPERLVKESQVLLQVPKWAIETWIHALTGERPSEDSPINPAMRRLSMERLPQAVDKLVRLIKSGKPVPESVPSLQRAVELIRLASQQA